jgi:hypothetical protein
MAESSTAKKTGDLVRVLRQANKEDAIENDWSFVRFEPDSGNLIAEKNGKRINCPRKEYDCLNFPGSGNVWQIASADPADPDLAKALAAWAKLDIPGVIRALLSHARTLDPGLIGIQTIADLTVKVREIRDACLSSIEILRLDMKRAEAEYNRAPIGTSLENDQKDNLLERWRSLQDRHAARVHLHDKMLPVICGLVAALQSLEAAAKSPR